MRDVSIITLQMQSEAPIKTLNNFESTLTWQQKCQMGSSLSFNPISASFMKKKKTVNDFLSFLCPLRSTFFRPENPFFALRPQILSMARL